MGYREFRSCGYNEYCHLRHQLPSKHVKRVGEIYSAIRVLDGCRLLFSSLARGDVTSP